jgi:two-component system, NtrC family, response regulator GlrR
MSVVSSIGIQSVLVVDDDSITLDLLKAELEHVGFRVETATDLSGLRQRCRERNFDLVLIDLFLGEESGLEAIPFLVREFPYTKIIIMSAHGSVELAVDALERGATSFVCKSKDSRELLKAIQEKMSHSSRPMAQDDAKEESPDSLGIIGNSEGVRKAIEKIHQFKDIDSTVVITGESGTGKELIARGIHNSSSRASHRWEAVNCGAIPENLLESELFGHRKGAFTDAKTDRKGLFEICSGGTLFLDEISEMPLALQVKILRVLQEREITPLGAVQSLKIDTRVVAATNRDLMEEVKKGTFRSDLYYRLNVLNIHLPPLRERQSDIPILIETFVKRFNHRFRKSVRTPSKELEARLLQHEWPGNIRELQNAVERGVVLSQDDQLHLEHMLDNRVAEAPEAVGTQGAELQESKFWQTPLSEAKKQFEMAYLRHLLETTKGNVSEVARISGRYRTDIYRLLVKYGMDSEEFRA